MPRHLVPLAVLLLSLAGPLFALPRDEPPPDAPPTLTEDQRIKLMESLKKATFDEAQVLLLLRRPPQHVARQVLYHRYLEQWVYDRPYFFRIEIDYRRGQRPQILTVHSLTPSRP